MVLHVLNLTVKKAAGEMVNYISHESVNTWTDGGTDRKTDGRYQVHYIPALRLIIRHPEISAKSKCSLF